MPLPSIIRSVTQTLKLILTGIRLITTGINFGIDLNRYSVLPGEYLPALRLVSYSC